MFYVKLNDLEQRAQFIRYMKEKGVYCVFHYVPLHSSEAGIKYGYFSGTDNYTTMESNRLVRLPMYYGLSLEDKETIVQAINDFFIK